MVIGMRTHWILVRLIVILNKKEIIDALSS